MKVKNNAFIYIKTVYVFESLWLRILCRGHEKTHGKVISSMKLANAELFNAERLYIM